MGGEDSRLWRVAFWCPVGNKEFIRFTSMETFTTIHLLSKLMKALVFTSWLIKSYVSNPKLKLKPLNLKTSTFSRTTKLSSKIKKNTLSHNLIFVQNKNKKVSRDLFCSLVEKPAEELKKQNKTSSCVGT